MVEKTRGPSITHIFVSQVLQQLEFSVCALGQDGRAEGLHDLLDGDILVRELIARRAVGRVTLGSVPRSLVRAGGRNRHTRPVQRLPFPRVEDPSTCVHASQRPKSHD